LDKAYIHLVQRRTTNVAQYHERRRGEAAVSRLVDQAGQGTTTIIAKAGTPIAKIVPLHDRPQKVVFGTGKGFFSPEAIAAIEAPLPNDVLAAFHDNMEP
jgi:antitoxin (DNA-binding transcriptional repressor) of toxin-antitoxin stability system